MRRPFAVKWHRLPAHCTDESLASVLHVAKLFGQERIMMKLICVSEGFEHAGKVLAQIFLGHLKIDSDKVG